MRYITFTRAQHFTSVLASGKLLGNFARRTPNMGVGPPGKVPPGWSRLPFLFMWMTPLVRRGWSTQLEAPDIDIARWISPKCSDLIDWYDTQQGSYRRRAWSLVRWRLLCSGLLFVVYVATQLAQPLLLRRLVQAVESNSSDGLWSAFAIGGCGILGSVCKEQQLFTNFLLGAELRAVTVAVVYRKALRLRQAELPPSVSNLLLNDAQKLLDALPLFHQLWATPLVIFVAAVLLVLLVGWASLVGVLALLFLIPANLYLVQALRRVRASRMPIADQRVARCVEMVKGMRVLKFNGWDVPFEASILEQRERELPAIRTELYIFSAQMTMTIVLPQIATLVALVAIACVSPERAMSAQVAFPTLSLMTVIRFPLMFFGDLVGQLVQASVALRRLDAFLSEDDGEPPTATAAATAATRMAGDRLMVKMPNKAMPVAVSAESGEDVPVLTVEIMSEIVSDTPAPAVETKLAATATSEIASEIVSSEIVPPTPPTTMIELDAATADAPWIEVKGASVTWERTKKHAGGGGGGGGSGGGAAPSTLRNEAGPSMAVRNLSLSVRAGELLLVAGPVGAGKSTLLAAILGEVPLARGSLSLPPSGIAYCSQVAWVQNMSIRDNILFGRPFERQRYLEVLRRAAIDCNLS